MNRKTDIFLNKYKELESLVSAEYDLRNSESAVAFLMRRQEYRAVKEELEYCREVRNLLTHNPKINDTYAVEPSDAMIQLLDRIISRVRNPKRAKHIWIPRGQTACRTMNDHIRPALIEMNDKAYSHIPILHDDVVDGVFSENTLLCCFLDHETISIDSTAKFRDIAQYLPLNRHRSETFCFVGKDMLACEIEDIFTEADRKGERIGLIFVTENGDPNEKLLGIISVWDLVGLD